VRLLGGKPLKSGRRWGDAVHEPVSVRHVPHPDEDRNAPSSLTAFFLYKRPDYAQEIDIEIFNDDTGRIMFSTYSGFAQTNNVIVDLPIDLTTDLHVYAIEYDPGSVRFLLDGAQLQSWSSGVPSSSMYLFANAWFPFWLAGRCRRRIGTPTSIGSSTSGGSSPRRSGRRGQVRRAVVQWRCEGDSRRTAGWSRGTELRGIPARVNPGRSG
jgi:beta-glucanase (GH16 family)